MPRTTFETDMSCQSCLSKISAVFNESSKIQSWEADLNHPSKILIVDADDSIEPDSIIELVAKAGFRARRIDNTQQVVPPEKTGFKLSTYRPLFLVVAYVAGATVLLETADGVWEMSSAMRLFMGFFFLGFAFFKLLDISSFATAFARYDILAKRMRVYALIYPWLELLLGIAFVLNFGTLAACVATLFIMGIGLIGVTATVMKGETIQCACLGTAFNLPMSVVTIVENSIMIIMSIVMLTTQLTP